MAKRSPPDRVIGKHVKDTALDLKGVRGITAIGFAWQHVFTVTGHLHDLTIALNFRVKSDGVCWKAVYVSSPIAGRRTTVHVLLVEQDQVYAVKTNGVTATWVDVDPAVELQLRRLHHR